MTVIDVIGLVVAPICLNSHGEEKWFIRGESAPELRILVPTCNTLRSERPRFPGGLMRNALASALPTRHAVLQATSPVALRRFR